MDDLSRTTFEMWARSLSSLERTLHQNSLCLGLHIANYDGSDPKLCRPWIADVVKWSHHGRADDKDKKYALFISARGAASDFIQRYLKENANCTWHDLRKAVLARFATCADADSVSNGEN